MATRAILPFIVEDGSALSTANSYCSVLEADVYLDRILDSYKTAWTNADEFMKQQALVWATSLLDQYIYFPSLQQISRSIRLSPSQALQFPRAGLLDYDGYVINERSVPSFMKNATAQMAFELLKGDRSVEPTRGIVSASVGPLSVDFDTNYAHGSRVIPRSVLSIVSQYGGCLRGRGGTYSVPLFRA